MKKKYLILLVGIVILVSAVLGAIYFTRSQTNREVIASPTPSATLDPFSASRELLKQLSGEFGRKFFTYAKPDDPRYFASIKPYMTEELFQQTARLNSRYASVPGGAPTTESEVTSVQVKAVSETGATVDVNLNTNEGKTKYVQTIELTWVKRDSRWSVEYVKVVNSEKT